MRAFISAVLRTIGAGALVLLLAGCPGVQPVTTQVGLSVGTLVKTSGVIDATNTDWMWRAGLIVDARRHRRPAIAIVFNLPLDVCLGRNAARSRKVPASVIRRQVADVIRDIERLDLEGFAAVHVLRSAADVDAVRVDIEKGPVARALTS